MVVGCGQIAKAFSEYIDDPGVVIFASGVSNSNEVNESAFEREKKLLTHHLKNAKGKKFVYFSSCALSNEVQNNNPYFKHKLAMEFLVKKGLGDSYIFRLPQLFGKLKRHPTLINYLYYKIIDGEEFTLYDGVCRYVIDLRDVVLIVNYYLLERKGNVIDIANPYAYSIQEIVECLEAIANKKGSVLNRVGSPPSCGHPLITRYSGGLEWGPG